MFKDGIHDAIVLFALKTNEDAALLKPARGHIAWIEQRFNTQVLEASNFDDFSGMLVELGRIAPPKPLLIEVISHGSIGGDRMCSDFDSVAWNDVASAISQLPSVGDSVVDAMSTCLSFSLIEAVSANVAFACGSNLTADIGAFTNIKLIFEQGRCELVFCN